MKMPLLTREGMKTKQELFELSLGVNISGGFTAKRWTAARPKHPCERKC